MTLWTHRETFLMSCSSQDPPWLSLHSVHDSIQRNRCSKPRHKATASCHRDLGKRLLGAAQSPWPRGRWWGQRCSELIPGSTSSAIITQTFSTDLLAQDHPRWLLPQGALCSDTLSRPIYQQDWGKTSWWKYASMVSNRLLIFWTSTPILK